MMEFSFSRPFVRWNIRSRERMLHGTFVPKNKSAFEHSFVPWKFWQLEISYFYTTKEELLSKMANYVLRKHAQTTSENHSRAESRRHGVDIVGLQWDVKLYYIGMHR